jgi:hypothetical protein
MWGVVGATGVGGTQPAPPTRRRLLRTMTTVVAVAALAGCGTTTPLPPRVFSSDAGDGGSSTVVMLIRHGEKPEGRDSGPGLDVDGNEDDSSMTATGWARAHELVDLFDPAPGAAVRAGLARPKAIYAARPTDEGRGMRTRETVGPLAERLGIPVTTRFGKGEEEELAEQVIAEPGPTLISWQHSGIPVIAEAFPGVTPTPPEEWPDDTYDVVWTFTKTADGWHFAQLPELVLPQDDAELIED